MTGPDPKTEKADLRKRMREALKQTPAAQIAQWSARITEKLIELPEFQQAASLMVYLSFATEYQTADLIGRPGRVVTALTADRSGEVLIRHAGQQLKLSARSEETLTVGDEVVVVEVLSPTLVRVEAHQRFWGADPSP